MSERSTSSSGQPLRFVMPRTPVLFALCFVMAVVASTAHAAAPRTALVLPPVGIAVADVDLGGVAEALRDGLPAFDLAAMSADDTRAVMRDLQTMGVACALDAVECIVQIGGIASVDVVLASLVSQRDGNLIVDLLVVDVGSGAPRGRTQTAVRPDAPTRKRDVEGALAALLRPEVWRGVVTLVVDRPGAQIVIDGVARGFSPLKRPVSLSPGRHELFVGLEGFRPHREILEIAYADQQTRRVSLVPGPSEPPPLRATTATTPPASPTTTATTAATSTPPPTTSAPARRTMRVALYEPSVAGVAPRVVAVMQEYLAAEIRKRERVSVLGTDELRSFLRQSATDDGIAQCAEDQCLADVAAALGVDVVVLSQFTEVGGELFFGVRRIDQDRQEVVGSYSSRIPASELSALLPLVGESIEKTFADVPLRAGEKPGVDATAARRLTPPPLPPAAPVGLGIAAGAMVVGGAASLLAAHAIVWGWQSALKAGGTIDRTYTMYTQDQALVSGLEFTAWTAMGLGAAAGAGAAVAAEFTDWDGLANENRTP